MTEHSWFGPASQASQQCSQDLHTMFPLLPPMRSPHRDRDADAALGHAIALGYAQGPGAWGANEIIMPDGARFSMLEADPMKLTYY